MVKFPKTLIAYTLLPFLFPFQPTHTYNSLPLLHFLLLSSPLLLILFVFSPSGEVSGENHDGNGGGEWHATQFIGGFPSLFLFSSSYVQRRVLASHVRISAFILRARPCFNSGEPFLAIIIFLFTDFGRD